ncbi:carbon-nitrogen hydrolase family protein [Ornithinimicrobium avium]|uniref:Carbon-nitrogen hydrolase family protein n=1 Tax=Ornithinimicrobium avium TaxID=2283195 RepID=A0A345NMR6_9MICO|nr:carbon-nitrogen hydrolase family protein [Ornithinimicrobium avium]AXH96324.1 carbon-nitrogen hydrolase family protein [Ornithinimicrobium avium]
MSLTVAVAQYSPTQDTAENLATIESLLRRAAERGARLVVLPEYAVFTVPDMGERLVQTAEPLDGPTVTRLREIVAALDLAVVVGVNEEAGENRIHNTLLGLRGGEVVATYRKVHLYDAFGYTESDRVVPGTPGVPELLEVDGFRVGMQTCYDLRFPESSRVLVDAGADVLAVPAQWVPGPLKEDHWTTLVRARAVENTAYVMAAGQTPRTGIGGSAVVDPAGVTLAGVGEVPGIGVAVLDRDRLTQVRSVNPALARRRYRVVPDEDATR